MPFGAPEPLIGNNEDTNRNSVSDSGGGNVRRNNKHEIVPPTTAENDTDSGEYYEIFIVLRMSLRYDRVNQNVIFLE